MHDLDPYHFDRELTGSFYYSANVIDAETNTLKTSKIVASGSLKQAKFIEVKCNINETFHGVRHLFNTPYPTDGLTIRFRLRGWKKIHYVAIGCDISGVYRHIKITNPKKDTWQTISFSFDDLVYLIQNDFNRLADGLSAKDICIKVKGTGEKNDIYIDIMRYSLWTEDKTKAEVWIDEIEVDRFRWSLMEKVYDYQMKCLNNPIEACERFYEDGSCPIVKNLPWLDQNEQPEDLQEVNTYRYSWHALHHVSNMILYGKSKGMEASLTLARDFLHSWMDKSWFEPDPDIKFTWYDHGVAERQLSLLMMFHEGAQLGFSDYFMHSLRRLILLQGRLLESEAFYTRHQLDRYHNHAMFQDLALLITALAFPSVRCSKRWLRTAVDRLEDQVSQLIIKDGNYAVFIENSIGYHSGVIRLLEFSSDLISLFNQKSPIHAVYQGMKDFSALMSYPDGRHPAQGDTMRIPNEVLITRTPRVQEDIVAVLPVAGYGVIKGEHDESRFMFLMLATSLSRTHKHEDNLSFTLFYDMVEWLIDPSFYSHEYEEPMAKYLRSALGHNALVLPELSASIEPGLVEFNGSVSENEFSFEGVNRAYEGIKIHRMVQGARRGLKLKFKERVDSGGTECGRAVLVFHCGEHVDADVNGSDVILSTPSSEKLLKLSMPTDDIRIDNGVIDDKIRGVSGLGFMTHSCINMIECEVPVDKNIEWSIEVFDDGE